MIWDCLLLTRNSASASSIKEKIKELAIGVDVLTMSATPIPRTLNMAMSGIRDISIIEEAPLDRLPVMTYVLEYNLTLFCRRYSARCAAAAVRFTSKTILKL